MIATADVGEILSRLREREHEVSVARSAFDENTARTRATFHDTEQKLQRCISVLVSAPSDIEAAQLEVAELEQNRTVALAKRAELEQQIADAPDWRLAGDQRACNRAYERQRTLLQQLQLLNAGRLLCAPDQFYRRVEDLDADLQRSNARIESLRADLAAQMEQAEASLRVKVLPG